MPRPQARESAPLGAPFGRCAHPSGISPGPSPGETVVILGAAASSLTHAYAPGPRDLLGVAASMGAVAPEARNFLRV